ncbi:efflux RND transporter permease subunit [Psychromarinibacter sp. C21-152]|uniref:Efflux RND transporter permease subunit n=1 Tax=Psychromarinibacter sediminicola TaxID=3033385 RepID=A0AAE3NSV3_9RHOB|nr:efflux RND transporter permease subunit [Psychromarinibacter sediminicola]MDF0601396.1 efflux RND transporter permease subunit [Psychromarinibacter sediminicola]
MTGIVSWAASRARMVIAFIVLSIGAGALAYATLPKEGEPDIEIPAIFISVPFPGISAEDSEKLLIKPMETQLADLDGLDSMSSTAAEGYAGVALEFEFGWDKTKTLADVRDAMNTAEAEFPNGAEQYSINEINFSEFPIVIVNLTGAVPERTLLRVANDLQERIEALDPVLEAPLAGHREEMVEVVIDPLRLEAYNVTAGELINAVSNNNLLIAAGEVETDTGTFSVKIPASLQSQQDVYDIKIVGDGDRSVTLGELADIRLTFEDRTGTARFNGEPTVALQVVKKKGYNLIDTAELVKREVAAAQETWPEELRAAIEVGTSNDQSFTVASMVSQLEGSVLTAIALVMIVVLASLGIRSALLVGFAIPTSFLLCFVLLAVMDVTVSNIVMFGLILAVGMLVDGAIVVVEYADKRIQEGTGPMHAYVEAAQRMFWPIVASTATTLCAFLPMLFWPGVAGEFMGMLPVTLIFVLSASLIVALVYLPIMGGVAGRISRKFDRTSDALRRLLPWWILRAVLVLPAAYLVFIGAMQVLNSEYLFAPLDMANPIPGAWAVLPGAVLFLLGTILTGITMHSVKIERTARKVRSGHRHTLFGWFIKGIAGNPIMPLVTIGAVLFFVVSVFSYYGENNLGVDFFAETEPEQAIVYVRARGNLSLQEKDDLLREVENVVLGVPGVANVFAFAGEGGLDTNTGGAQGPRDSVGQVQLELTRWEDRPREQGEDFLGVVETESVADEYDGDYILAEIERRLAGLPGIKTEILNLSRGPASAKPVHLRLTGENLAELERAANTVTETFEGTAGLIDVENTTPLPGIDWEIDVDVEAAGRYGADVATIGGMVQLVTRGLLLDTMRVPSSDEEIDIRVRFPEKDRLLSTLETLKVRTADGLIPLSNFLTLKPVEKLEQIDRVNQKRYYDVKAAVAEGMTALKVSDAGAAEDEARIAAYVRPLDEDGAARAADLTLADGRRFDVVAFASGFDAGTIRDAEADERLSTVPVTATERIETLTAWLETEADLPADVEWEWTGDQEDQQESQNFLMQAFGGALGLMFIILLAQFNSFYDSVLVLLAVVLSTTGVLIGMLVMQQPFSIIMTGTGIVALAGIVVNNNIVLIDTYQAYKRYMPEVEAIVRTAEARLRPVILTTITTMAGLTPMMLGLSLDFIQGGYSINSPTSLWWKQLATAVVFGLGVATILTLVVTPSMLALKAWVHSYALGLSRLFARMSMNRTSAGARDWALRRSARKVTMPEILWDDTLPEEDTVPGPDGPDKTYDAALLKMLQMRAAE